MKQLKETYPVQQRCDLLNCARSSYYYEPHQKDEAALVAAIEDMLEDAYHPADYEEVPDWAEEGIRDA